MEFETLQQKLIDDLDFLKLEIANKNLEVVFTPIGTRPNMKMFRIKVKIPEELKLITSVIKDQITLNIYKYFTKSINAEQITEKEYLKKTSKASWVIEPYIFDERLRIHSSQRITNVRSNIEKIYRLQYIKISDKSIIWENIDPNIIITLNKNEFSDKSLDIEFFISKEILPHVFLLRS